MRSNVEIAQSVTPRPIQSIARKLGITVDELIPYGRSKAKVSLDIMKRLSSNEDGKLILVTAINATRKGEGKTTQSIGIAQAMAKLRKKVAVCLREPSLAPVFGTKGGGCGAGYAQVIPMEDINLHFTGDLHAIGTANNLLAAMIDNHVYHGNSLGIDPDGIIWSRAIDISDRALRRVTVGVGHGGRVGVEHAATFQVTAASEIMAVHGMARNFGDLKKRLGNIVFGFSKKGKPLCARDLKADGPMAALLRDSLQPNLVQTMEGVPVFVHGGPFANIAHGCNSVVATRMALKLADYVVTEAGFGSDLGAEKFFDVKCRTAGLKPAATVLVATIRALRHHGGAVEFDSPDMEATRSGCGNLRRHIGIVQSFGMPMIVVLNRMPNDRPEEIEYVTNACQELGVKCFQSQVYTDGGNGALDAAREVVRLTQQPSKLRHPYSKNAPLKEKAKMIATKIYGGKGIEFSTLASKKIRQIEKQGYGKLPVIMAKTHASLSGDPTLLGAPEGFKIQVRDVRLQSGAGTVVMICGSILTMPGLSVHPGAEQIDITGSGKITGLF
jgi:formate--tetrahydrofolate ligase